MEIKTAEEYQKEMEAQRRAEEEKSKKPEELSRDQKRKWKASARERFDSIWNGKSSWR